MKMEYKKCIWIDSYSPMLICRKPPPPLGYNPKRVESLAIPKTDKMGDWGNEVGNVQWGDQQPLREIKSGTLKAIASDRIRYLAKEKQKFSNDATIPISQFEYSCGRGSPIRDMPHENNKVKWREPSDRLLELAKNKYEQKINMNDEQNMYSCGRVSPIWKVTDNAKNAELTDRTEHLSRPKDYRGLFNPDRAVETVVSEAARNAQCSNRLKDLSKFKQHPVKCFIDQRQPEMTITKVSSGARKHVPSEHTIKMSKAKATSNDFVAPNLSFWVVRRGARNLSKCSERVKFLSAPIIRNSMNHVQLDPDAFLVSAAAKKAKCTARLQQLSAPIKR